MTLPLSAKNILNHFLYYSMYNQVNPGAWPISVDVHMATKYQMCRPFDFCQEDF